MTEDLDLLLSFERSDISNNTFIITESTNDINGQYITKEKLYSIFIKYVEDEKELNDVLNNILTGTIRCKSGTINFEATM